MSDKCPKCGANRTQFEGQTSWDCGSYPSLLGGSHIHRPQFKLIEGEHCKTKQSLTAREAELAEAQRRVENVMAERDRWCGLYSRLQDERAADFAKWFKIIDFGGLTEYQAECPQVIDLALRELTSWRWLAEMFCTVQAMASTVPDYQCWVVLDVDGEALGEGETPIAAIEDARKNFLPPDRITHIPGKEEHDGEMH